MANKKQFTLQITLTNCGPDSFIPTNSDLSYQLIDQTSPSLGTVLSTYKIVGSKTQLEKFIDNYNIDIDGSDELPIIYGEINPVSD